MNFCRISAAVRAFMGRVSSFVLGAQYTTRMSGGPSVLTGSRGPGHAPPQPRCQLRHTCLVPTSVSFSPDLSHNSCIVRNPEGLGMLDFAALTSAKAKVQERDQDR